MSEKTARQTSETIDLWAEMQRAADLLPTGFVVSIHIEQGAGWVEIEDNHGNKLDWPSDGERTLKEDFRDAVQHACDLGPLSEEESDD